MPTYSLSRYILSIKFPEALQAVLSQNLGVNNTIEIGGKGSYLDSFSFNQDKDTWSVDGDDTGSYVFNKTLSRTGTASLTINQMSDQVAKFKALARLYYDNDWEYGLELVLTQYDGGDVEEVVTCKDCYITKIPTQQFQSEAQTQSWSFVVGEIIL